MINIINNLKILVLFSVLAISGCSITNAIVSPYTEIFIEANDNINPDLKGRSSPVSLYIFELTSSTLFESQDFFSLYENPKEVLGSDLIFMKEISLYPNSKSKFETNLKNDINYIGIIVAYRDVENSNWRKTIKVDRTSYDTYKLTLDKLSIIIN